MSIDLVTGVDLPSARIEPARHDSVSGLAVTADGRHLLAVHQGTGELTSWDVSTGRPATASDWTSVRVGEAPRGLVLDGPCAYTTGYLDRRLHVVDVARPALPRFDGSVSLVANEPFPVRLLNGKRMFYRSRAPRHSGSGLIACASCHPDGGSDGQTWDFTESGEGLRSTIDLRGRAGLGHGPLHWSANFDEVQDFENDIVTAFGGAGLAGDGDPPHPPPARQNGGRSADLDDLARFVASARRVPTSPYRAADGSLSAAARRGRALFYDAALGCAGCHPPPAFTISALPPAPDAFRLIDVGTLVAGSGRRLGRPLTGIDVPTLKGVWDSAPYLHAGQAETLRAVLTDHNRGDRHGRTSHLDDRQIADLERFLLELDEGDDALPRPRPLELVSPPGAPVPLLLRRLGDAVEMIWGFVPGAASYRVARGLVGAWDRFEVTRGGGLCDGRRRYHVDLHDAAADASFFYLVAAVDGASEGPYRDDGRRRWPSPFCPEAGRDRRLPRLLAPFAPAPVSPSSRGAKMR